MRSLAFALLLSACGPLDPDIKQAIIDRLEHGGGAYYAIPDYSQPPSLSDYSFHLQNSMSQGAPPVYFEVPLN